MPNAASLAAISQGILAQAADDLLAAADHFKMPVWFRTEFDTGLTDLEHADSDTALTESDRTGGSGTARAALDALAVLEHDGYKGIAALPSFQITAAQRAAVFAAYGWSRGLLGEFNDARVLGLARLAVRPAAEVGLENVAWGYSAALVAEIARQLKVYDDNHQDATGAGRAEATGVRNARLDEFGARLGRLRHLYAFASPLGEKAPELRRIGFLPRRDYGALGQGTPPPAGPAAGTSPA